MNNVDNIRQLQLVELEMLKEIVRICSKNNLTYYLSAGTFLGAVRHKGFIPWDDDADIRMPREDYEKLLEVLPNELNNPYIAKHFLYDKNVHRYYLRITNPSIKLYRTHNKNGEFCDAWLDVFPLDGMPKNKIKIGLRKIHLLYRRMMLQISVFDEIVTLNKKRHWYENIIIWIVRHTSIQKKFSYEKMWYKLDKVMKKCSIKKSQYIINFMGMYKFKDMMPKSVYGKGALYEFENLFFNGPQNYDEFLKHLYGNYMELPPIDKRNNHSVEIIFVKQD